MLVPRVQAKAGTVFRPQVKKTAAQATEKLSKLKFDINPNKFFIEPAKDLYTKRCGSGDGSDGVDLHGCYNYVDLYCC